MGRLRFGNRGDEKVRIREGKPPRDIFRTSRDLFARQHISQGGESNTRQKGTAGFSQI